MDKLFEGMDYTIQEAVKESDNYTYTPYYNKGLEDTADNGRYPEHMDGL